MRKRVITVGVALIAFAGFESWAQTATGPKGAKELFFDPGEGVVSGGTVKPVAATTPALKSNKAKTGTSTKEASVFAEAKAPKLDESGRRQVELAADTKTQRALGLSYWIELEEAPGKPGIQVTDGRAFKSGERIRIHFRGNADGRISIIQLGSSGTSDVLFPDPPKGLTDNAVVGNRDQVLPSERHWFRFDGNPGTERLLVFFAKSQAELENAFPTQPRMDVQRTAALMETAKDRRGSKDLLVETEVSEATEVGTYGVSLSGKPVVLEIALKHR